MCGTPIFFLSRANALSAYALCITQDENYFWYFVIRFMATTGARVSELIQFKVEHLKLGYMDLYSKGGKCPRIYLPKSLTDEALNWLTQRNIDSGFIFSTKADIPSLPEVLTAN